VTETAILSWSASSSPTSAGVSASGSSALFYVKRLPLLGRRICAMTYVITQPCIGTKDASCVEVCPVDCIHSTDDADQYFINPDECIDCGVCAEVCPVEAIFFEDDVPEQWANFIPLNKLFFDK
jgi:ferredoxin